jgi:hypothetical protein
MSLIKEYGRHDNLEEQTTSLEILTALISKYLGLLPIRATWSDEILERKIPTTIGC